METQSQEIHSALCIHRKTESHEYRWEKRSLHLNVSLSYPNIFSPIHLILFIWSVSRGIRSHIFCYFPDTESKPRRYFLYRVSLGLLLSLALSSLYDFIGLKRFVVSRFFSFILLEPRGFIWAYGIVFITEKQIEDKDKHIKNKPTPKFSLAFIVWGNNIETEIKFAANIVSFS